MKTNTNNNENSVAMVDINPRKRARNEDCCETASIQNQTAINAEESRAVPKGFVCPLTMEVMFDPVLDAEGNTYERSALLEWLKEYRSSPISRQPLSEKMLVPNNALRDAIHEYMGQSWVQQREETHVRHKRARTSGSRGASREKIDCFLQFASKDLGGLSLSLNDRGCCAFRFDDITVVIDVPDDGGMFCLYTRNLVFELTEPMKDLLLEMNFSQGDTRGGCLSVKKHDSGKSEVMFSYTDRVAEVSARDFLNIILNFLETALNLRRKLQQKEGGSATASNNSNNQVANKNKSN